MPMKKEYIKPQTISLCLQTEGMLAQSGLKYSDKEADKNSEVLTKEKMWDRDGIWE